MGLILGEKSRKRKQLWATALAILTASICLILNNAYPKIMKKIRRMTSNGTYVVQKEA